MMTVEAFILAGGLSSRMGTEKGLVAFRGQYMIRHVMNAVEPTDLSVSLVASDPRYREFGCPVYSDELPGLGPIGGLYTALKHCKATDILLLSCDIPLIGSGHLKLLLQRHSAGHITVACDKRGRHPLCAVYPVEIRSEVERRIKTGQLRMLDLLRSLPVTEVFFGQDRQFSPLQNFNSPADLFNFEAMEKGQLGILSFGRVKDITGEEPLMIPLPADTDALITVLHERYPDLRHIPFRIAVNRELTSGAVALKAGDEVALLPPFSGG